MDASEEGTACWSVELCVHLLRSNVNRLHLLSGGFITFGLGGSETYETIDERERVQINKSNWYLYHMKDDDEN